MFLFLLEYELFTVGVTVPDRYFLENHNVLLSALKDNSGVIIIGDYSRDHTVVNSV